MCEQQKLQDKNKGCIIISNNPIDIVEKMSDGHRTGPCLKLKVVYTESR